MLLGGVQVAEGFHLEGHSDGDAVAHAITDALLGAAGDGDIGAMFPDTDEANRNRDSLEMLAAAVAIVHAAGYIVGNVDVTVIAERPKLSPFREAICSTLAQVLGVESGQVGVKGKTNEGLGWIGRGEGLACFAVASIWNVAEGES
jgi:2-C-methyl-D-erythritol 2,4-cyclodiphosphate synthase